MKEVPLTYIDLSSPQVWQRLDGHKTTFYYLHPFSLTLIVDLKVAAFASTPLKNDQKRDGIRSAKLAAFGLEE